LTIEYRLLTFGFSAQASSRDGKPFNS